MVPTNILYHSIFKSSFNNSSDQPLVWATTKDKFFKTLWNFVRLRLLLFLHVYLLYPLKMWKEKAQWSVKLIGGPGLSALMERVVDMKNVLTNLRVVTRAQLVQNEKNAPRDHANWETKPLKKTTKETLVLYLTSGMSMDM